jgi:hypothetical protein
MTKKSKTHSRQNSSGSKPCRRSCRNKVRSKITHRWKYYWIEEHETVTSSERIEAAKLDCRISSLYRQTIQREYHLMKRLLPLFYFLFMSVSVFSYAGSDAEDKNTANHPMDPAPSKFKMIGISAARKTKALSTMGPVEFDGYFIDCPEKKTTSPVRVKVGVKVDLKKRPDIVLTEGEYFVETTREDITDPAERLTIGKGRNMTYLEEGRSEVSLNLPPGKYSLATGFRFKNRPAPGGWVSDTCTIEVLKK